MAKPACNVSRRSAGACFVRTVVIAKGQQRRRALMITLGLLVWRMSDHRATPSQMLPSREGLPTIRRGSQAQCSEVGRVGGAACSAGGQDGRPVVCHAIGDWPRCVSV